MLSFTIDNRDYECPMGFGEITISEYATYCATVLPLANPRPAERPKAKPKGYVARMIARLQKANQELLDQREPAIDHHDRQMVYEAAFCSHWLKCPMETIERLEEGSLHGLYMFINDQWQAWEPIERIQQAMYMGRLWTIDYSFDRITSVPDLQDLQSVAAHLFTCGNRRLKPRDCGSLSLHVMASVMVEIKRRHSNIAPIIGDAILKQFNIQH